MKSLHIWRIMEGKPLKIEGLGRVSGKSCDSTITYRKAKFSPFITEWWLEIVIKAVMSSKWIGVAAMQILIIRDRTCRVLHTDTTCSLIGGPVSDQITWVLRATHLGAGSWKRRKLAEFHQFRLFQKMVECHLFL